MAEFQFRQLTRLDEMYEAVGLQRVYWGDELESLVPAQMMFTIAQTGGQVIAAFDGNRMVGILIGLLGVDTSQPDRPAMANLLIYSKRMVVLPEYRSYGIATQLKLMQRDLAIQQGIRLVVWTFDPLLSRNAHLNLRKLGAISRRYVDNYYGETPFGGLATLGYSDRFSLEWWVNSRRVRQKADDTSRSLTLEQYLDGGATLLNLADHAAEYPLPADDLANVQGAFGLLEIPLDYPAIVANNKAAAIRWREHTRSAFHKLIDQGLIVTDFVRGIVGGQDRGFYVLGYDAMDLGQ